MPRVSEQVRAQKGEVTTIKLGRVRKALMKALTHADEA